MTAVDRLDNGQDEGPVLVARCGNYREDLDQPCTGTIRYRWGMIQAACDTCGGWCGVAVARWTEVTSGRAGAGEQQREQVARWLEQKYLAVRAGQPWSQSADAVELLALLDRTQPDGEADRTRYESHQWMGGGDDEDCCAACGVSWIDCEGPCNPRPCPVYSHGTDGWHCAVEGPHDEHRNAAGTETW